MADTLEPLKGLLQRVRSAVSRHRGGEISGLRIVQDPENAEIDIVAVHGLGGQGFRSWITWDPRAGKSKSWLQDLLAKDVPHARIMTYGYISDGVSYRYIVRNVVYGRAFDLAKVLAVQRAKDGNAHRPLFFIAHSLGGWIVKRALIISSEAVDPELKDIELSTCGVAFFGTLSPGRPSSPSPLAHVIRRTSGLVLEDSASGITTSSKERKSRELAAALRLQEPHEGDLEWLETQMGAFKAITANLPRLSFYETQRSPDGFVVEQHHSIPGSNGEQIGLTATHSDLIRFYGRDANYTAFIHKFRDMVDSSKVSDLIQSKRKTLDHDAAANLGHVSVGNNIPYGLPSGSHALVRRSGLLDRLGEILSMDTDPATTQLGIATLYGAAGTGKSSLARQYADNHRDKISFVFWVRGESWETVIASYLEFADTIIDNYTKEGSRAEVESVLGLSGVGEMVKAKNILDLDVPRVTSIVRAVKDWLLRPDNRGWLLIFDNVAPTYDIFDFIPLSLSGRIILTSTDANCCPWGTQLRIEGMTEQEAVDTLASIISEEILKDPIQADAAAHLVRQLSYHPQSVVLAATTIRNKGVSVAEYRDTNEAQLPLKILGSALHQSPVTKTILQISAMLSLSVIPVALFNATSYLERAPESLKGVINDLKDFQHSDHLDDVLQYLMDYGFIQTSDSSSPNTSPALSPKSPSSLPSSQTSASFDSFVVDSAAREHVREALNGEDKFNYAWMACGVCTDGIRQKEADSNTVGEVHGFGRIMAPHAKTCYDDWSGLLTAAEEDGSIAWHILGQVCMTQGAIDQAIGCFELCLRQNAESMDMKERIQATLSLASLLQQAGQQIKSKQVLSDIDIESIDQALGFRVALARASATEAQGELSNAESLYEMLELEQEAALGPTDMATVGTVQKLAMTLERLGKLEEAQALYRRVYISYRNTYGQGDRMTLDALDDLANIAKESLAINEAEALYQQSLDIRSRLLGPNHPETAHAIQHLAVIDDLGRRYGAAKEKYQKALSILGPSLGKAHPLYTTTMENLALSSRWHAHSLGSKLTSSNGNNRSVKRSMSTASRSRRIARDGGGAKTLEQVVLRDATRRREFEEAERLYLEVLTVKKAARALYTDEDVLETGSKLAEMYENEDFFAESRGAKLDELMGLVRGGRRRGTI